MINKRYTVVVTEKIKKIILKLPSSVATKIENSLLDLEEDPRPPGCKKLKATLGICLATSSAARLEDKKVLIVMACSGVPLTATAISPTLFMRPPPVARLCGTWPRLPQVGLFRFGRSRSM